MASLFDLSLQPLTFLTILGIGFLYILVTGILGQFFDHEGDGSDGASVDSDHDTISVFSPKIIAIFMVGFGAAGIMTTYYGWGAVSSTLAAIIGGGSLGLGALLGLRLLYSQQASSDIHITDAQGLSGSVVVEIPSTGLGEVALSVKGRYLTYFAQSGGQTIPRNTRVTVKSVDGNTLVVAPSLSPSV